MSSKSKSGVSETPNAKVSPATPRVSKPTRGVSKFDADSPRPLQNPRVSPRSLSSKPTVVRSPKLATPPEKKTTPTRIPKPPGSELQAEINQAHEDLKKAKEKLISLEKEKDNALDDLKEAQRMAEESNEKLKEALMAQKRAEENSEIENFRAIEMEQVSIEAAQKKEEEWQKELETMRNQHTLDVAALLSTPQEIQKAMQEVAMISDAKEQALRHADDVTKIAEAHAEKIEILSAEIDHLKSALNARAATEASKDNQLVSELQMEIDSFKCGLQKVKSLEETLAEKEAAMEQLNVDLEAAQMAESYARSIVDELHKRAEELSSQTEQAKRLERSATESLECVMKQLEGSNDSLHLAKNEIVALKEKVGLFEISIQGQRKDLEEAGREFIKVKNEASEMGKEVESLRSELEMVKEERNQSLNNEKLAAASVMTLLEEKNKLINELGISRDEEDKTKKALESLASAMHEVSSEARDTKEKLLSTQVEHENYESQLEDLKQVLKATNEKYNIMLEEASQEIKHLTGSIQLSSHDHENSKVEWEQKELHLMNIIKKTKDENSDMESEIHRLINLLKVAEERASATRDEYDSWKNSLKEAESEAVCLKEILGVAKAESMKLKDCLMDREKELQNLLLENEELRKREAFSMEKVEELSTLLEQALSANNNNNTNKDDENGELTDSEKDYHVHLEVVEFFRQNGTEDDMKTRVVDEEKKSLAGDVKCVLEVENSKGKVMNEKEKENSDSAEVGTTMWESCKIEENDLSFEHELLDDEMESKTDGAESFDQVNNGVSENVNNGGSSPSKEQRSSLKKKKPLLRKFGNLLKKGTTAQK